MITAAFTTPASAKQLSVCTRHRGVSLFQRPLLLPRGPGFLQRTIRPGSAEHPGRRSSSLQAQKQQFTSFEDMVQNSQLPVLVEFYATWCGPCQMMGRTLEAVAPTLKDKVRFVKIDSEKYGNLAGRYHVQGLPTLLLFKNGRLVDRVEGMLPERDFRMWLQQKL